MSHPSKKKKLKAIIICILWLVVLSPLFGIFTLLTIADDGTLPDITTLENPKTD